MLGEAILRTLLCSDQKLLSVLMLLLMRVRSLVWRLWP